ncbi:shikimate dehydrogenase [Tunturiibacter gelidoferens]|uniref:Multifunctional fusion protein n=1 Tax=Tunturiibacter gelidiferens TaxID=3069689 RepID=A0A9X0QDY8_9BACT|nr:shikimate dehydrogenase [Edaphobacter lichenicola]MBB5328608.1 3-dehydroquinate dehydratase/shikimate dehydrogenase [Edaphobacter lichenicola]
MPSVTPQFLRSRIGKVCVAIIGATPAEMLEKATAVVKETPFLEFRLDYLEKPLLALPKLKHFLSDNTAVTAIATCRRSANGGKFSGNLAAEMEILSKAGTSGFHIVDLELESAESLKKGELQKLRDTGVALIISHHDFAATKDLDGIFKRIEPFQPDFIKIVPTAKSLTDNVTLMRFIERMDDHSNIVGICMGDAGIISRVLGLRAGSAFTFAAATAGEETGPGQIAARTLIETYRIDQVDAATKVYGVAGNPIRSSLSPIMMNTAFRRETVNAVYLALQANKLADLLKLVHEIPIQGLSVTMPLKQEIMAHLEKTDPLSAKIGACNTVLRQDGKLYGFNTDVAGITGPIEKRMSLRGAKALVIGAGGAARAAVFGMRDKGAEVFILNRTAETAQKLAKQSGSKTIKKDALSKTTFDVIVNATPVGMAGIKSTPTLEAADLNTKLVFDLVYNPLETPLLRLARQQSIPIITGIEMFVQQGARQFEIFTGKPAPEEEMLRVVIHALRQQAESVAETPAPAAKTKKAS